MGRPSGAKGLSITGGGQAKGRNEEEVVGGFGDGGVVGIWWW